MAAGTIRIGGTAREAIGFAGTHFEEALRLCWLPVLLSLGALWGWAQALPTVIGLPFSSQWAPFAFQGVALALAAMYYGPLVRLAARGEAPDHGTAPLRLGWSPVRYFVGTVLSLGGAALLTAPVTLGARGLLSRTEEMRRAEVAAFEPDSLHAVEFVPAFDPGVIDLAQMAPMLLFALGVALLWGWTASRLWTIALTAVFLVAQVASAPYLAAELPVDVPSSVEIYAPAFALLSAYVALRLAPLPWFWAARRREDAWPVLRSTLAASAGGNRFRLLLVLALLLAFNTALGGLLLVVPAAFGLGISGADALLSGTTALTNGGEAAAWVEAATGGARMLFGYAFVVATTALGAGVTAGLGGALVRQATDARG